jgi:hypothetical protein
MLPRYVVAVRFSHLENPMTSPELPALDEDDDQDDEETP